jgi:hypothetical protein
VPGADSVFSDTRYEADGVVSERAPALRRGWKEETLRYRYDDLVVFVEQKNGVLTVAPSWPVELGVLPPGSVYDPRARIRTDRPRSERVSILDARP